MCKAHKFNLIELLVVVVIMAILFTFTVNKIGSMSQRAQVTKVQTELHSISAAILNYKREYGVLPYIGVNDGAEYPTVDMSVNFSAISGVLRGDNKRGINFLNQELVGLFSTVGEDSYDDYNYQLALDYDNDGEIDLTVFANISYPLIEWNQDTSIAVWSRHPSENTPDIRSWVDLARNTDGGASGDPETNGDLSDDGDPVVEPDPTGGLADDCTCVKTNKGHGNNVDGYDSDNTGNKGLPDGADADNQTDECGCDNDEKTKGK